MENSSNEWEIDNLPNRLTLFRVLLIPVILACLFLGDLDLVSINQFDQILFHSAAWIFVIASITDFFDGYIARKRNIVTVFGSFLDPMADKFLVVSCLIFLQAMNRVHVFIVVILVLREMYITALRLMAVERNLSIPVGNFGKLKTATQMVAIPMLMVNDMSYGIPMDIIGLGFISLAAIFSLYSAIEYSVGLVKKIKAIKNEKKTNQDSPSKQEPKAKEEAEVNPENKSENERT